MSPLHPSQHAAFAKIVGEEFVRAIDGRIQIAPADVAQLAAVLQYADSNGLPMLPQGGGTKLHWGNPMPLGPMLSMHRMNAVKEHAWQDMTCTVQGGCTWAAMQSTLAQHGQCVALDPLSPKSATIGGIISTNDSGALRLKYGGLRDLIIGMTIVLADGTIAKTGGKVVKNVAGYDLHKLMTGAYGTLGVIAEVNFRLHPIERSLQTWSITANDAFALDKPLRALLDSQLAPVSAQIRCGAKSASFDIRLATSAEQQETQQLSLESIAGGMPLSLADDAVWQERERLAHAQLSEGSTPLADELNHSVAERAVLKLSLPHDEICNFLARVQHIPPEISAQAVAQANGLLLLTLEGTSNALARMIRTIRTEVSELGGNTFVQNVPLSLRESIDAWGEPPATLALMQEIKRRFDPNQTLNPGRFVGGI